MPVFPGPDAGMGGKHVVVPPDEGQLPDGVYSGRSSTNKAAIYVRAVPVGGDLTGALESLRQVHRGVPGHRHRTQDVAAGLRRGNAAVDSLGRHTRPRSAAPRVRGGNVGNRPARVAVCGEIAADPAASALLIGLGVRELSVAPPAIPTVKSTMRTLSVDKATHLASLALQRDSAASVRALLGDLR